MNTPRIVDNDRDTVSIVQDGETLHEWEYTSEAERREKMKLAWTYMDGWHRANDRAKATFELMFGFIEEVRDHKPEVISGRRSDPQDDVDDLMPVAEFYAFQGDAERIVGPRTNAPSQAAAEFLMFGKIPA